MRTARVVPALLILLSAASAPAGEWPRFRGPDGAGVSDEKNIPVRLDKPLWKTDIPGHGHSSPVVWGDDVFLTTSRDDGKVRVLMCLSAADGKVRWSREVETDPIGTHKKGSPAAGSPTVDAERVYVSFLLGRKHTVIAYDKAGKELWRRQVGEFFCKHGPGASPVVADGKVIVVNDTAGTSDPDGPGTDGESFLTALSAATGEPVWKAPRATGRAVFATPLVAGRSVIAAGQAEGVTAYDLESGRKLWGTAPFALRTVASPIAADGLIIAVCGQGTGGRQMIAVRPEAAGADPAGKVAWEAAKMLPYVPTPVAFGKHLYVVADTGIASCFEAATGKTVWSHRLGGNYAASPIVVDGRVYAVSEDGELVVFAADPGAYKEIARSSAGAKVFATPAVSGGRLFLRTHGSLLCYVGR